MTMYVVYLQSEEFGREVFKYATKEEALAGMDRLLDSARVYALEDGIEREVVYAGKLSSDAIEEEE